MYRFLKTNMARMSFFPFDDQSSIDISFRALHRLSHHAEPGDLFPVTGELVDDKTAVNKEETNVPQERKRRAFRT